MKKGTRLAVDGGSSVRAHGATTPLDANEGFERTAIRATNSVRCPAASTRELDGVDEGWELDGASPSPSPIAFPAPAGQEEPQPRLNPSKFPAATLVLATTDAASTIEAELAHPFFSSSPPPASGGLPARVGPELDELARIPRTSLSPEELYARQLYYRRVVVKVMALALLLFAFALCVLWQRGAFDSLQ